MGRIGRDGFADIFDGLNEELLRSGLLPPEMHVDSKQVKAKVHGYRLSRIGLAVEEFRQRAIEEYGPFIPRTCGRLWARDAMSLSPTTCGAQYAASARA